MKGSVVQFSFILLALVFGGALWLAIPIALLAGLVSCESAETGASP